MIDIPNATIVAGLRRIVATVQAGPVGDVLDSVGLLWIEEVIERSEEICEMCSHDRRWHAEHRPRHPFRVNGRRSR